MDIKQKILKETVRLFGENGYEGTSLDAIAEAVGVRKQSLLHHYKSKGELRNAVIEELISHWRDVLPNLLAEASSGYGRFDDTIGALVAFLLEDTNRARVALREMLDRPEETRRLIAEQLKPWTTLIVNYIQMGKNTGIIKPEVDSQSYLILVMITAFSAVSIGSVASALAENEPDSQTDRRISEFIRIAHDSLFIEQKNHKK